MAWHSRPVTQLNPSHRAQKPSGPASVLSSAPTGLADDMASRYSPPGPTKQSGNPSQAIALPAISTASVRACGTGLRPVRPAECRSHENDHKVSSMKPCLASLVFRFCTVIIYPNVVRTSSGLDCFFLFASQGLTLSDAYPNILGHPRGSRPMTWLYRHAAEYDPRRVLVYPSRLSISYGTPGPWESQLFSRRLTDRA